MNPTYLDKHVRIVKSYQTYYKRVDLGLTHLTWLLIKATSQVGYREIESTRTDIRTIIRIDKKKTF